MNMNVSEDIKEFRGRKEDIENEIYKNKYAKVFLDFLNEYYPKASIKTLESYFSSYKNFVFDMETVKSKYLYEFNESDILEIFNSITTSSNRSPQQLRSLLNKYFEWSFMRQLNPSGINPMKIIDINKIKKNNTKLTQNRYISKDDLFDICKKLNESGLASEQQTIVLLLARYGIVKNTIEDICNLKITDLDDENNLLHIRNEKSYYDVAIDNKLKIEIRKAYLCEKFERQIFSSDSSYIVKSSKGEQAATPSIVRNRLFALNQNCSRKLTLTDMEICCKIDRLKEIKADKEDGRLSTEDFRQVQIEFGKSIGSYKGLQDDYVVITGDDNIDNARAKEAYRIIDGKRVYASDLGLTEEELEQQYPQGNTTKGRRARYLKSKQYNSKKEVWDKED